MQSDRPRTIVVLGTGGTIAGSAATPTTTSATRRAAGSASSLAACRRPAGSQLEAEQVAQVDSKDMDFAHLAPARRAGARHLARRRGRRRSSSRMAPTRSRRRRTSCTACSAPAKPVVLTGAMRPGDVAAGRRPAESRRCDRGRAHAGGARRGRRDRRHGPLRRRRAQGAPVSARCVLVGRRRAARTGRGRARCGRCAPGRRRAAGSASTCCRCDPARGRGSRSSRARRRRGARCRGAASSAAVKGIVVAATGNGTLHQALEAALLRRAGRGVRGAAQHALPRRPHRRRRTSGDALPSAGASDAGARRASS